MKPLRILFLTVFLPSPPSFGGQRRLEGLLRGLARRHQVSVVSFVDPRQDVSASIRATQSYCDKVVAIPNARYAYSRVGKRLSQMRSLLSNRSYEHFLFDSPPLRRALHEMLRKESYDIISVECSVVATNLLSVAWPSRQETVFMLDAHNIDYDLVHRAASSGMGLDRRLYSQLDWRKLRGEEREVWEHVDGCAVTSARDEEIVRRDVPTVPTAVVPNAVDPEFFSPRNGEVVDPATVLFFGSVSYPPNRDGLLLFIRETLPRLKSRYPTVKLRIVGPFVPPEIAARAGNGIEVTGPVDDIRPEVERATVVVVPIRVGGGTRFKILEAMAMGKAVVSTTVGAEGIDVRHGRDILLADEPEDFAVQVGRLLENASLRQRMGTAGRALIEGRYCWGASVARLEEFYAELLARRSG